MITISRRRVLQGAAATGVVLTLPAIPLPAVGQQKELELVVDRLAVEGASFTGVPAAPGHGSALSTASARHLLLPVTDVGGARMVGLSWQGPTADASLRFHGADGWSGWVPLHVDPSEAPDDETFERVFTNPLWLGQADAVELVVPDGVDDLELHRLVEGSRLAVTAETPAAGALAGILPRSSWGARAYRGNPVYASDIRMAVIHHSAGANGYAASQVPSILAGIQRFHQDSRGWNDVAYNFLVDRFGRVWEGRAGGIDRAVIGGHTFGANTGTIGICYLGTATASAGITPIALGAIASVLRWKFNQVHAVPPNRTTTYTPQSSNSASKYPAGRAASLNLIVGHSTMSQTACPGEIAGRLDGSLLTPLTTPRDVRGIDTAPGVGYWLTTADGQAFPRNGAPFHGSMAGVPLNGAMLGMAPTRSGRGYWMLAADGGIFSFGDARFHGSTGGMRLNQPVVGMATTAGGNGYWLVASDGGVFSFGDAPFHGSMGGVRLNQPVVGMIRTPSGRGYWMFASDGGIFSFGDAPFFGSAGGRTLPSPAVSVAAHPNGSGYWLALANGTVLSYNVPHYGGASVSSGDPVVGMAVTASGRGYWLATRGGSVHRFGDAT